MMEREDELLRVLSNSVRVLSLGQVAGGWWSDTRWGRSRARVALAALARQELVCIRDLLSRPVDRLSAPLLDWTPGDVVPNFQVLASHLHRRAMKSAELITVVFASAKCAAMLRGTEFVTVKITQLTHDLHVADVFLHYRRQGLGKHWISEDGLPSDWRTKTRPDAALSDDRGNIVRAVEYGGNYTPGRLKQLHNRFATARLSYELW